VTVFERDDRPGGLLRYGIPEFKMEKWRLDRRLDQMRHEGTTFECAVEAGVDVSAAELCRDYRAVVLAGGGRGPPAPARSRCGPGRHPPGDGVLAAIKPGGNGRRR